MSRRVLVVEDDPDIRSAMVELLRARGYEPLQAADGAKALDLVRAAAAGGVAPSVILLDLVMPVLDGRAFLRARRADPRIAEIPVILLSAERGEVAREVAAGAPGTEYVEKPAVIPRLLSLIDRFAGAA
jgi:CheY-like chemotaxis protein